MSATAAAREMMPIANQWAALIGLFESDRAAFYRLAVGDDSAPEHLPLADLAQRVRSAVNETYEIEPAGDDYDLVAYSGERTPVPASLHEQIAEFLRAVDGKAVSEHGGKDYEGTESSEAEMQFKLGGPGSSPPDRAGMEARLHAKPVVLRVDDEDLGHLACQPAYVTRNLLHCARRTVLAPTAVFQGLKRGDGGPPNVENGWAICGKPRRAYHNDGSAYPTPEGMVFLVYADSEGFIFDWDWVQEDHDHPGYPLGPRGDRFGRKVDDPPEFSFDVPTELWPGTVNRTRACYSSRGDCLFYYLSDDESFAARINPDLTVFQQFGCPQHHTGFKIKNVRRILEVDQSIKVSDPPGLTVTVASVLLKSFKRQKDERIDIYEVLIGAMFRKLAESQSPTVELPAPSVAARREAQLAGHST